MKFKRTTRSSSNTRYVKGVGHVTCPVKAQAMWDRGDHTVDAAGVVRWTNSNNVPPLDILEDWAELDLPFSLEATVEARAADTADFLARYRANPPKIDAEQLAEMRAAFGPGTVVVDFISGRKTQL